MVVIAAGLVLILGSVAIVVDLGQLRVNRRTNQSATDLAALAAGYHLSGRGAAPSAPVVSDPRAGCAAAINDIQTNVPGFAPEIATTADRLLRCASFPAASSGCVATTPPVVITSGYHKLSIRYPVPDSEIRETRFKNGVGASDGSNMCARMRITLEHSDPTFFAGIFGRDEQHITATSVVRANTSALVEGVAAMLLLERMGCGVLQTSGGGNTGSGVVVLASSGTNPGVIQTDSAGQVGSGLCTTNENADGYVIYGTALPAAGGGGPSIKVEPAANGTEGIVAIRAIELGGRGGAVVPSGLSPAPVGSGINSRQVVDTRYNHPAAAGGHAQVSTLHNQGRLLVTRTTAPAGWATLSGDQCNRLDTTRDTTFAASTHIFVLCSDFTPDPTAVFPAATHLIFTGKISVANGDLLSLPAAQRVYVRGCPGCSGGSRYAISVAGSGELRVNTLATGTGTDLACADRPGPGVVPSSSYTSWSVIATFDGPFLSTGQVRLCQTTVYLGKDTAAYARQSVEGTGIGSPTYPPLAECSPTRPCPSDAGGNAYVAVTGGSGSAVDWTAPNQIDPPPTGAQYGSQPFEDLALWTEGSLPSRVGGQGSNVTAGVFFVPNSSVAFTGQATQTQPLNAQFIARRLDIAGQGSLFLRPSKDDAVPTRIPGAIQLIR